MPGEPGDDQLRVFNRLGIPRTTPEGQAERLANGVTRSLVIGMGVRQGVGRDGLTLELAEDPSNVETGTRVDQDAVHQVDVDDMGREAAKLEEAVGESFHR
jgi:hypothetical protein